MSTPSEKGKVIYLLLLDLGFNEQFAKYLTAQAAHETGNFTSLVFARNNNLFGMKLPKVRKTTAKGERHGHAIYESQADSIEDLKIYLKEHKLLKNYNSIDDYIEAISEHHYFEADFNQYLNGCKYFLSLYFNG